jgi:hypothetical protein
MATVTDIKKDSKGETAAEMWTQVARSLPGRTRNQALMHWRQTLQPKLLKNVKLHPFSRKEDILLWRGHRQLGNKWKQIYKQLFDSCFSAPSLS